MPSCPSCAAEVLDIDVKCASCGTPLGTTGAHRMIGSVLLGQYEITDVLGQGGMSIVYKARHRITEQDVALKLLPPELAAHSQVKSRFLEEARALAQLDHPNIVHLYNFGQENGAFVLAMQFVQGDTWERMILTAGRQPWPVATRIAIDVARALEYAHGRGIVHRDMKPSNVLVRASDGAATVMDFGIAKMQQSSRLTATGQTMGTVRYMSPEQVRGHQVDLRTDLYSLGATLYEALVGDTPFDGDTHFEIMTKHLHEPPRPPSALGVEVPPALEAALLRALAKKPDDRFQEARELRKALEQVLKDADVGLAETQRLMRDSVPPANRGARPAAAAASPAAAAGPTAPSGRRPATGLAAQLEPSGSERAVRPRRTGLWLGLGALVAAAGAAVAVLMLRGDPPGARASAPAPDAPAGGTGPAKVEPFLPADVTFAATGSDDAAGVSVHVSGAWTPAEVLHVWTQARARLDRYAAERAAAIRVPTPFTIVVVPARVLCDPRTFERGEAPADCKDLGHYYRPREQTLIVADDRVALDANLGIGLAVAACVHQNEDAVCDLVGPYEQELRKGS